jgi:hypothetical protein
LLQQCTAVLRLGKILLLYGCEVQPITRVQLRRDRAVIPRISISWRTASGGGTRLALYTSGTRSQLLKCPIAWEMRLEQKPTALKDWGSDRRITGKLR